jgi:hypothetical protein
MIWHRACVAPSFSEIARIRAQQTDVRGVFLLEPGSLTRVLIR